MSQTNTIKFDECWLWAGIVNSFSEYGLLVVKQPNGKWLTSMAHRVVYESEVGEIEPGLHLDHLCRVRRCVNPEHLEPVTPGVNAMRGLGVCAKNARKTHCPQGHEYTPENTYSYKPGFRDCRECRKAVLRRLYWENKEKNHETNQ